MINPTNIFAIPTVIGATVASTGKSTGIDNAVSVANRFRDLVIGADNTTDQNDLHNKNMLTPDSHDEAGNNTKPNVYPQHAVGSVDLSSANMDLWQNLENASPLTFIAENRIGNSTFGKQTIQEAEVVKQTTAEQVAVALPRAKITRHMVVADILESPNPLRTQSEYIGPLERLLPASTGNSETFSQHPINHTSQLWPIDGQVKVDSIIENRSEASNTHPISIDINNDVRISSSTTEHFLIDNHQPLPIFNGGQENTVNKRKVDDNGVEFTEPLFEVVVSGDDFPIDSEIFSLAEPTNIPATYIQPVVSKDSTAQIESLVYLTWFATGELSFTGNTYLSSIIKDSASPSTNSFVTLNIINSGFHEPIQYPRSSISRQPNVNAATTDRSSGRNSTSNEKVISPGDLSSFIALRFPEFAKRKLTVVNSDGAVDIVIRDYEVSDTEIAEITRCISTHFSANGKILRSLTLNGTRVN